MNKNVPLNQPLFLKKLKNKNPGFLGFFNFVVLKTPDHFKGTFVSVF